MPYSKQNLKTDIETLKELNREISKGNSPLDFWGGELEEWICDVRDFPPSSFEARAAVVKVVYLLQKNKSSAFYKHFFDRYRKYEPQLVEKMKKVVLGMKRKNKTYDKIVTEVKSWTQRRSKDTCKRHKKPLRCMAHACEYDFKQKKCRTPQKRLSAARKT